MVEEFENIYKIIVDNSAVGIMMANEKEQLISWNKFTESLLGMTKEDLDNKPVQSFYTEEEWKRIRSLNIRKKGMQHHMETQMIKKDGSLIEVDISLSVIKNLAGRITGSIGVFRDISERKIAEAAMKEAYEMKKEFISMVSHELNTPITSIEGSIKILIDELNETINEEQKEFLLIAKKNIDRLKRQISDVLDYQRLSTGNEEFNIESGDINTMVKLAVGEDMLFFARSKGVGVKLDLGKHLPAIEVDQARIVQIIKNLVENGIKFTEKGQVSIATIKEKDMIRVSVKDNGIGIKQADINKLFQIFTQLQTGGERLTGSTGLGLALSKIIIEKHQGTIGVESKESQGSTFYFQLPIKASKKHQKES